VPNERRKKLDDKAEKCIFLGVSESSKAYKLFNLLTKKIVVSRDVTFDEENIWEWNRQASDAKQEQFSTPCTFENLSDSAPITPPPDAVANEETTQTLGRVRKRPVWMKDYKVTGIEDPITHFALFSDCDPTCFESVVKEENWIKAMDDEIDAIKRNDTWELSDLPKG